MRSFHRLSLVLGVFLFSCSLIQAQHLLRHENPRARHRRTNKPNDTFDAEYKRDGNAAFTYFVDGQGACGAVNGPNDFIVALNAAQYAGGAHCFEMITITINGKSAVAQITDECLGCPQGGLDFSQGLFQYFAPLSDGELYGSWTYNKDVATPSSTPVPSATPSSAPPTTMATTSSMSLSTTITTSSASTIPSPTSTTSTVPTSTPQDPQMLAQINLALLELGVLLQASFKLED